MAFSAARSYFQRMVTILRSANTPGFNLQALDVANPATAGTTPVALTLAMATDNSLWVADGTAWSQLATGGGSFHLGDDDYITVGDNNEVYIGLNVASFGEPGTFVIANATALSGAAGSGNTPGYFVSTRSTITTTAGVGKESGRFDLSTGGTVGSGAGVTGGSSGDLTISTGGTTGAAGGSAGNSGGLFVHSGDTTGALASGEVEVKSGDATGAAATGAVSLVSGDATAGDSGSVTIGAGTAGGTRGLTILQGPLAPAATPPNTGTGSILMAAVFGIDAVESFNFTPRFSGQLVDAVLVKLAPDGGPGDTITVSTPSGAWLVFDLNGVTAGTVMRMGSAGVTLDFVDADFTAVQAVTVAGAGSANCAAFVTLSYVRTI